jgi:hypothetical protein
VARDSWWMTQQSSSFSSTLRGSPMPGKRAKRVPPVPTPQDGTATWKAATFFRNAVDVDAAARQLLAERGIVGGERLALRLVVHLDGVGRNLPISHSTLPESCAGLQRVNEIALPASTLMMLPVDFAARSEARK